MPEPHTAIWREREVVCIAGDGDFLMNGQEFATAVQYDLPFVTVIADNGIYGTIRMHQEREYPGRIVATDLRNPDFVALAHACGAAGVRVHGAAALAEALGAALERPGPTLLEAVAADFRAP